MSQTSQSPASQHGDHHDDPGLQPERTALSWERTTVSLAVVSAILLRWTPQLGVWVFILSGGIVALSLYVYATQRLRYRMLDRALITGRAQANISGVLVVTVALLLFGLAGFIIVATTPR